MVARTKILFRNRPINLEFPDETPDEFVSRDIKLFEAWFDKRMEELEEYQDMKRAQRIDYITRSK